MEILVVTNNLVVFDEFYKQNLKTEYIDGTADKSMLRARDLVVLGWHLAADPRGGYNKRFNPYHTVFLCDQAESDIGEDILQLETTAYFRNSPYSSSDMFTERERKDFQILDASIARRTLFYLRKCMKE